jgi:hypothetical protein
VLAQSLEKIPFRKGKKKELNKNKKKRVHWLGKHPTSPQHLLFPEPRSIC